MSEYENPLDDYWPNSEGREAETLRREQGLKAAEAYKDRIISLNAEAMGHRDEWDKHGNAVFDLVMEMTAHIEELCGKNCES